MKVKLGEIMAANEAIRKLASQDLPFKASYAIAKLARALDSEVKLVEEERVKLVRKHGVELPVAGEGFRVPAENMKDFAKDYGAVLDEETELEVRRIRLHEELMESARLTVGDVLVLEPFIEIEQEQSACVIDAAQ